MAVITGTPFAQVGQIDANCSPNVGKVPGLCTTCRQLDRWMARTVGWTTAPFVRFKNILRAILIGHDEVLQSLCGSCANNPNAATTCECLVQRFLGLGFALQQEVIPSEACPTLFSQQITWFVGCPTRCTICPDQLCIHFIDYPTETECGEMVCRDLCPKCEVVILDPCNNPGQLDIMMRLIATAQSNMARTGKGEDILAALMQAFPGSVPRIVKVEFGVVYVMLDRPLSVLEQQFIHQLLGVIPAGFGVKIELVTPCA